MVQQRPGTTQHHVGGIAVGVENQCRPAQRLPFHRGFPIPVASPELRVEVGKLLLPFGFHVRKSGVGEGVLHRPEPKSHPVPQGRVLLHQLRDLRSDALGVLEQACPTRIELVLLLLQLVRRERTLVAKRLLERSCRTPKRVQTAERRGLVLPVRGRAVQLQPARIVRANILTFQSGKPRAEPGRRKRCNSTIRLDALQHQTNEAAFDLGARTVEPIQRRCEPRLPDGHVREMECRPISRHAVFVQGER